MAQCQISTLPFRRHSLCAVASTVTCVDPYDDNPDDFESDDYSDDYYDDGPYEDGVDDAYSHDDDHHDVW